MKNVMRTEGSSNVHGQMAMGVLSCTANQFKGLGPTI